MGETTGRRIAVRLITLLLCLTWNEQVGAHSGHDDGEANTDVNLKAGGLIAVKIYCLVFLLVTTFAGGVSPYFFRWNESFLLLGTQFAGGVFLGTAMMHFLADANSTVQDLTDWDYPFVYMLASSGYLLTMLGDVVVLRLTNPTRLDGRVDEEEAKNAGRLELHPRFVKVRTFGDIFLLILALCFHSVFEGIAVGVADSKEDAWKDLWTISLDKIFAAVAIGMALLRMLPERSFLTTAAYSFAFAISSPIGVAIGIATDATTQGRFPGWIFFVYMGIAIGVFELFIYVAINHLIIKGFKPRQEVFFDTPFFKFLAFLAGVIAVVMIWD